MRLRSITNISIECLLRLSVLMFKSTLIDSLIYILEERLLSLNILFRHGTVDDLDKDGETIRDLRIKEVYRVPFFWFFFNWNVFRTS